MIPYDDLVIALSTWRARQGLPVTALPPVAHSRRAPSSPTQATLSASVPAAPAPAPQGAQPAVMRGYALEGAQASPSTHGATRAESSAGESGDFELAPPFISRRSQPVPPAEEFELAAPLPRRTPPAAPRPRATAAFLANITTPPPLAPAEESVDVEDAAMIEETRYDDEHALGFEATTGEEPTQIGESLAPGTSPGHARDGDDDVPLTRPPRPSNRGW